jgi:hypothetical protein
VDGYLSLPQTINVISSIFEEDVFDWFLEPTRQEKKYYNEATDLILNIADALDGLDLKGLKVDLIRELYHGFFDRITRRALGEFYTNEIIVNEILSSIGYVQNAVKLEDNKILLDASCGSGSFLVGAISVWRTRISGSRGNSNEMARILQYITNNIVGIDIHPFAVAMARVNYLLAILDLLTPEVIQILGEVKIPIFWSDSLIKSEQVKVSPIIDIKIPKLGDFQFPDSEEIPYNQVIQALRTSLVHNWNLQRYLDEFQEDKRLNYQSVLEGLHKWFTKRKHEGKNGRWLTLLENSSLVHSLIGNCAKLFQVPPSQREWSQKCVCSS